MNTIILFNLIAILASKRALNFLPNNKRGKYISLGEWVTNRRRALSAGMSDICNYSRQLRVYAAERGFLRLSCKPIVVISIRKAVYLMNQLHDFCMHTIPQIDIYWPSRDLYNTCSSAVMLQPIYGSIHIILIVNDLISPLPINTC